MKVSRPDREVLVMRERLFKHKNLNGLFKILMNLCNLLRTDQHFDHCYCNLTYRQCWMCNFANYVVHNKIQDELFQNKLCKDHLVDIAYRFLFYIKRIRNDGLDGDDRKWVLGFFKQKFKSS